MVIKIITNVLMLDIFYIPLRYQNNYKVYNNFDNRLITNKLYTAQS